MPSGSYLLGCGLLFLSVTASSAPSDGLSDTLPANKNARISSSSEVSKLEPVSPWTLSAAIEFPVHSLLLTSDAGLVDAGQVDQRIQFSPTFGPNLTIRAGYGPYRLSFTKRLDLYTESARQTYGRTDYDDYRMALDLTRHITAEVYFQQYQGFFIDLNGVSGVKYSEGNEGLTSHPSSPASPVRESKIVKRPDVTSNNYGGRLQYRMPIVPFLKLFAPDSADLSGSDDTGDWDIRLIGQAYYNRLAFNGSTPLVPSGSEQSGNLSGISNLEAVNGQTLGLGMGFSLDVPVTEKLAVGLEGVLNGGIQNQTNYYGGERVSDWSLAEQANVRFYTVYGGSRDRYLFNLDWDQFGSEVKDVNMEVTSLSLSFAYGYQF